MGCLLLRRRGFRWLFDDGPGAFWGVGHFGSCFQKTMKHILRIPTQVLFENTSWEVCSDCSEGVTSSCSEHFRTLPSTPSMRTSDVDVAPHDMADQGCADS